jgi:hypothetical protein
LADKEGKFPVTLNSRVQSFKIGIKSMNINFCVMKGANEGLLLQIVKGSHQKLQEGERGLIKYPPIALYDSCSPFWMALLV